MLSWIVARARALARETDFMNNIPVKLTKLPVIDLQLFDANPLYALAAQNGEYLYEYTDLQNKQGWLVYIHHGKVLGSNFVIK